MTTVAESPAALAPPLPRLPACLTRRADGEVVVTGTRVLVVDVLAVAAGGVGLDDLAAAFPRVRPDRLAAVVKFGAAHPEAVAAYARWRQRRELAHTPADVSTTASAACQAPLEMSAVCPH